MKEEITMHRKILGLFFIILMLFNVSVATASTFTMAGFDGQDSSHVWSDNLFFTRMQELTNTAFTFSQYTDEAKWQAAKDAMFAGGSLPDVLFKAALSVDEQLLYSDSGQLIDLKPLLAEYAPNLWNLLLSNPDWMAAITLPNGKIAALPTINTLALQNAMWINQTWLDTLNLAMPTDFEALRSVLEAFQTQDPNRNGKQDEIPLSFLGAWDLKFLGHAFGLVASDYNIYVNDQGQVQFLPLEDRFMDFIQELTAMYQDGLLDTNGFSTADSLRAVSDSDADVTYGVFFGPNPYHLFTVELGDQYTLLQPLSFDGKQVYRDLFGPIITGTFAITSACADPGEALRWVDTLYTQEGAIAAMAGLEGDDYLWNDDGTWGYTADLEVDSSYVLYDLSIYDTGSMPWLFPEGFYVAYDIGSLRKTTQSLINLKQYLVDPFPYYYVLSAQQRVQIEPLQAELGKYVDESIARFILGETDISVQADIDAFREGLALRGVQEFISIWQELYDQQRIR
jgi:putative aldouronate transport system substrate-binding protein